MKNNMRRKYMAPAVEIYRVNAQTVMAGSPGFRDGEAMSGEVKAWNDFDESEDSEIEDNIW